MEKRYLITGVTGHLGGCVLRQLLDRGESNISVLVAPGDAGAARMPEGIEVFTADLLDREGLRPFFRAGAVVIHCAGVVSTASRFSQHMWDVNVEGTKNVVDLCREAGVARLVYVSSVHAITPAPHGQQMAEPKAFDPDTVTGPYAKTKATATRYVLEAARAGLDAVVVFPSGLCGPYDYGKGHLTQLVIDYCLGRLPAGVRGGFDFVDVRDVATGILAAAERGKAGETYLLTGEYHTVESFLNTLHEVTGRPKTKVFLPLWVAKAAVPFCSVLYKLRHQPPLFSSYSLYTLRENGNFTHEKASRELGYAPRPFAETMADTVAFLQASGRLNVKKRRRRAKGKKKLHPAV